MLTNFPSAVRHAWGIAGIHDALINGKVREARARAALSHDAAVGGHRSGQLGSCSGGLLGVGSSVPDVRLPASLDGRCCGEPLLSDTASQVGRDLAPYLKKTDGRLHRAEERLQKPRSQTTEEATETPQREEQSKGEGKGRAGKHCMNATARHRDAASTMPGSLKVPGSDAPVICIPSALSSNGAFSSFFAGHTRPSQGTPGMMSTFWPIPLPFLKSATVRVAPGSRGGRDF